MPKKVIYDTREADLRALYARLNPRRPLTAHVSHVHVTVVKPKSRELYASFGRISFIGNFYFQVGDEK